MGTGPPGMGVWRGEVRAALYTTDRGRAGAPRAAEGGPTRVEPRRRVGPASGRMPQSREAISADPRPRAPARSPYPALAPRRAAQRHGTRDSQRRHVTSHSSGWWESPEVRRRVCAARRSGAASATPETMCRNNFGTTRSLACGPHDVVWHASCPIPSPGPDPTQRRKRKPVRARNRNGTGMRFDRRKPIPISRTHYAGEATVRSLVRFLRACASPIAIAAGLAIATAGVAAAAPYTRLQVLLPGETAAPGTASGKTGSPLAQTVGVPFMVTVRACDSTWTTVTTVSHTIQILASDASATLPAPAQLQSGVGTFSVTFNANGTFTVFAHDQSDGTIPDGASSLVPSLVLQGFVFNTISQKHFTAGTPETMTIRAVDPQGNTVTGYTGVVRLKETTSFGDGRAVPDSITLTNGTWTGGVAAWRADETNINRGNCNFYAWLASAPAKNGTSDPFVVHPAGLSRMQLVVPGESALPGSQSGKSGTPTSQGAGQAFPVTVWATDAFWNPVPSTANVTVSSSDLAASTPVSGALVGGTRQFNITLNTVGTQTLTVTSASAQGMTSPGIQVQPNAVARFVILPIGPQEAGVATQVTINATDASGNTVPDYSGEVNLSANTGAGSLSPERVTISGGTWTGDLTFKGAGNSVVLTCSDFAAPPHIGASNSFVVNPGPLAGLLVLLPGETAQSGDPVGRG